MKNKKLLTGMLATVLSVCMICSNVSVAQAQEHTQTNETATINGDVIIPNDETGIPDENLYHAILEEADSNQDGVLTVAEAESVYDLIAEDAGIKNLTGIGFCKGLGFLDLSNNAITDITPLAELTQLEELRLSNNQISDLKALAGLTQIFELWISENQIGDISIIETMTGLRWFYAANNNISDISVLSGLPTNLIDVSHNNISSIKGLQLNGKIAYIDLSHNQLTSIDAELNSSKVDLSNNKITDVSGLKGEMNTLDLSNNQIRDISPLNTLQENGCMIHTEGNPIGEPEQPSEPEVPGEPVYDADDFATLIGTQDVVVKPNDYVTITFAQGSKLNDTTGKAEYDFTTTVTTEFANAKLPAFVTENSFITKVSYSYSGMLPASALIQIFVGADYVGKEVFYFLVNNDNTYNSNDVQKVVVDENGYITVTQEHCSDYVVTMENPADLYEKYEESQNVETDDNTNNDSEVTETGDSAPIGMLSIIMLAAVVLLILGVKGYKRA